jgi:dTDP-4-amino-4,6-dideoxygalactose transaminase
LLGGTPVRTHPYPPYNPVDAQARARANQVLESGLLSGFLGRGNEQFLGGPVVRELEDALQAAFGARHAVTVNSATSGLHAALVAAGVGPGDEVIVPPITMSATAAAAVMCGATPVFCDVEPDLFCLDARAVEALVSPRTRAIIPVNLFGQAADLGPLRELADRHGFVLVEDNAQAPGALYHGRKAGTIGHMGVMSFNRHKTLQCGEGGAVLTDDPRLARRLQLVRNHGEVVLPDWDTIEDADIVGYNYRLTELQAAVVIPQLARLENLNRPRIELAAQLTQGLAAFDFLLPAQVREASTHVYYLYPLLYAKERLGLSRATLLRALAAEGVHAAPYVTPLHELALFRLQQRNADRTLARPFTGRGETLPPIACRYPVAEALAHEQLLVTNICRPPHQAAEIQEFLAAVEKIAVHRDALRRWEETN